MNKRASEHLTPTWGVGVASPLNSGVSVRMRIAWAAVVMVVAAPAMAEMQSEVTLKVISPLLEDPTTVYGLSWYALGDSLDSLNPGNPISGPLVTGETYAVGLRFLIEAPASGTRWDISVRKPDSTLDTFAHVFTWYSPSSQGCFDTFFGTRRVNTACVFASGPESISATFSDLERGPCMAVGVYAVTLASADVGGTFNGSFDLKSSGLAAQLEASAATLQVHIPADATSIALGGLSAAGPPYDLPEVAGGTLTLTLTARDQLCPNLGLKNVRGRLWATAQTGGGHAHPASAAEALNPPMVAVTPGVSMTTPLFADGLTDDGGKIQVRFLAGEIALTFRIDGIATSASGDFPAPPVTFRVEDLTTVYTASGLSPLVGQTATHPDNHFAAPGTDAAITDLQARWRATSLGTLCGDFGINDISLEHGGVFDVSGDFLPPHSLHRRGIEFDVSLPPSCNYGLPVPFTGATLRSLMRKTIKEVGFTSSLAFFPEESIHFRPF